MSCSTQGVSDLITQFPNKRKGEATCLLLLLLLLFVAFQGLTWAFPLVVLLLLLYPFILKQYMEGLSERDGRDKGNKKERERDCRYHDAKLLGSSKVDGRQQLTLDHAAVANVIRKRNETGAAQTKAHRGSDQRPANDSLPAEMKDDLFFFLLFVLSYFHSYSSSVSRYAGIVVLLIESSGAVFLFLFFCSFFLVAIVEIKKTTPLPVATEAS